MIDVDVNQQRALTRSIHNFEWKIIIINENEMSLS